MFPTSSFEEIDTVLIDFCFSDLQLPILHYMQTNGRPTDSIQSIFNLDMFNELYEKLAKRLRSLHKYKFLQLP